MVHPTTKSLFFIDDRTIGSIGRTFGVTGCAGSERSRGKHGEGFAG